MVTSVVTVVISLWMGFAQVAGDVQGGGQAIDALALLAGVALHADFNVFQRDAFALGVPDDSQRLAGAERGVVQVVRRGAGVVAAFGFRAVGRDDVVAHMDNMPHRQGLISQGFDSHSVILVVTKSGNQQCTPNDRVTPLLKVIRRPAPWRNPRRPGAVP